MMKPEEKPETLEEMALAWLNLSGPARRFGHYQDSLSALLHRVREEAHEEAIRNVAGGCLSKYTQQAHLRRALAKEKRQEGK